MDVLTDVITAGALGSLILEAVKWIIRKVKKDSTYDFTKAFYSVMLPVLTYLSQPLLAFLSVQEYVLPSDWLGWAQQLVVVALSSLASVLVYNATLKPFKEYSPSNG
jgi:hypothetical protein